MALSVIFAFDSMLMSLENLMSIFPSGVMAMVLPPAVGGNASARPSNASRRPSGAIDR